MGVSARALRAGRAVIELGLTGVNAVEKSLKNLQSRVQGIGQKFGKIGSVGGLSGGGMGMGGFAGLRNLFVGGAASAALAWPVKLAAGLQLSAAQMEAFAGSGEVANKMILDLQEFSAVAFQSLDSLITQTRVLMSRGIGADDAVADIKAIAAIAAGSSDEFEQLTKAFADVKNATVLTGEEMRQFKNTAFNPLVEIGKKTGETMQQLEKRLKDQGISFAEVNNALQASVRSGGLFNGILEKISGTLIGQMKKAWAQFQLAVLPLGNELLAPLTNFFKSINGILPVFGEFIKQHSGAAKAILATLAAVAVAAVAFTALGLSINLVSIAATGFATVLGLVGSVLAAIFSPAGIVIGLLGVLAYKFFVTSDAGATMANDLGNYFMGLVSIANQAFKGISNALMAGNIQLAADILWAGLKLAWLQGTNSLQQVWFSFKDIAARTFIELGFNIESAWAKLIASLKKVWSDFSRWFLDAWDVIVTALAGIGQTDAIKAQLQRDLEAKIGAREGQANTDQSAINAERNRALAAIEAARAAAQAAQDQGSNEELARARQALKAAQDRLAALEKQAAGEAANLPPGKDWFGPGHFMDAIGAGLAKAQAMKPEALFDTRLARQTFGGNEDIARQSLGELKDINKGVAQLGGGGLAFV